MKSKLTQPWFIRRVFYLLSSLGLAVLAALGFMDEETGEQIAVSIGTAAGALAPLVAALMTGAHSDVTITKEDLHAAEMIGRAYGALDALNVDAGKTAGAVVSSLSKVDTSLPVFNGPTTRE